MSRSRCHTGDDHGRSVVEVLGLVVVVAGLVAALDAGAIGGAVADAVRRGLCHIADAAEDCADRSGQAAATDVAAGARASTAAGPQPRHDAAATPAGPADVDAAAAHLSALAGDPAAVAAAVAGMAAVTLDALIVAAPELLGNLDGVPPPLRYAANARSAAAAVEAMRLEADRLDADRPLVELPGIGPSIDERIEALLDAADHLAAVATPDAQILAFRPGPPGDLVQGTMSQVVGDLTAATHIGIVVPGVGSDLATFGSGVATAASAVLAAATAHDPSAQVAVVAHLGYDPPESSLSLTAARDDRAVASIAANVAFGEGIATTNPQAHVTLIGHSYGSLASAEWVRGGMPVDQIVLVGSPGAGVDTAAALGVEEVYVATAPDDPIDHLPAVVHGPDPTDDDFGAIEFGTGTASGHSGYTDPGTESLSNLGAIVLDRDDLVTLAEGS